MPSRRHTKRTPPPHLTAGMSAGAEEGMTAAEAAISIPHPTKSFSPTCIATRNSPVTRNSGLSVVFYGSYLFFLFFLG